MIKSEANFQAVVVGGGLVGKSMALGLSQAGWRVALLAPRPGRKQNRNRNVRAVSAEAPSDIGSTAAAVLATNASARSSSSTSSNTFDSRVYALSSSSQQLLDRLRVWSALDTAKVQPVYEMEVHGDARGSLRFSAFQADVQQLAWIVESSVIEQTLDAALEFQPGLTWFEGRAQQLDVDRAGSGAARNRARVSLDDGLMLDADLVIGADGAHSWVRTQMGAEMQQRDYRQTGVVANFKAGRAHGETARQWFNDGEIIALLPMRDQHVSLVWSARSEHAEALLSMAPEQLAQRVERITQHALGELECVTPARGFPLALQRVDRLVAPCAALVGDAAHLVHPLAGQGMNLGLRDVASLLSVLTGKESFRAAGDVGLLRRYERSRREDIGNMELATDGLQRLFSLPGGLARFARNTGMSLVGAQPLLKRLLVSSALG
jgi:2-octaprenylphenol hydroxylase